MITPYPLRFRQVAAALNMVTGRLARELVHPEEHPPAWSEFEWDIARAVSTMQGIAALLSGVLRWPGPAHWQRFLREQLEQGILRERRVDEVLKALDAAARREGVALVALKGSALRGRGLYGPGERPMGDIDLLAAPTDLPAVERVLRAVGYTLAASKQRHDIHVSGAPPADCPFGEHLRNPLKIETHVRIAERLPCSPVDITTRIAPPAGAVGIVSYPDDLALLAHLLLHATGNASAHALRLVQLLDIARLAAPLDESAWWRLVANSAKNDFAWWALPVLRLCERHCGLRVPGDVLAALRAACPPLLRRAAQRCTLTEVSWSNLRISALPAVAWSQSAGEAWRYALGRIFPGRVALRELHDSLAQQPQLTAVPWYQLQHRARIVRWVLGRAPRVQTLTTVYAALAWRSSPGYASSSA